MWSARVMHWMSGDTAAGGGGAMPSPAPGWTPPRDKNASMSLTTVASSRTAAPNKRPAATSEEHNSPERNSTESGSVKSEEHDALVKPPRKRKHRKATHTIRKEEKEMLLKEMKELNAKVADLQQRAMAAGTIVDEVRVAKKAETNAAMRRGLQEFQLTFCKMSAAMSDYGICNTKAGSPLHDTILLNKDQESRRETLCALRTGKLRRAKRFMKLRRPAVDPSNLMMESQRFEAENGDFFSANVTVTQFHGARSVKQVFDQLLFYFCNIEISVSEKIGHITVREDDDCRGKGTRQNRLVSVTNKGIRMESNTVLFSEYSELDGAEGDSRDLTSGIDADRGYGFIVADFVDDDKRHPYQSGQRVRKDISAVLEIRACSQPARASTIAGDTTVVLTKWVHYRLHHPDFPMRHDDWLELRDSMDLWGKVMQRTIIEGLEG